LRKELAGHS
jgi:hypothetical protein